MTTTTAPLLHLTSCAAARAVAAGRASDRVAATVGAGGGAVYSIMRNPRGHFGETFDGRVVALMPSRGLLLEARTGLVTFEGYARNLRCLWGKEDWFPLAPGELRAFSVGEGYSCDDAWDGGMWTPRALVRDGDTLTCACGLGKPCHRRVAAPLLRKAGWRIVLDGEIVP